MSESADKRSVSTDALETLGMVHFREEKRDAIHLAVMPAEALERLKPGAHVNVGKDGERAFVAAEGEGIGIVDPFLPRPVERGQRFWLVIYPRKIQSLRHVWSHPAVPDEAPAVALVEPGDVIAAKARIRDMAADLDCSVERLMDGAAEFLEHGDYLHFGFDLDYDWPADEFWRCYEIVTGKPVASKEFFFRCSC